VVDPSQNTSDSVSARILLADDHEIIRSGIKTLLAGRGPWEICGEAENGREAVEKVLSLKPDLVVLDLSMPIMNGIEAAREIRQKAPRTKIVIFSMHDSARIAEEATRAGADAYLAKTAHFSELENTIAALLSRP
jgi:DNA-binding NarL/FixJ family response regulator